MKKSRREAEPDRGPAVHPHLADVAAIALLTLGVITSLALVTHDAADESWGTATGAGVESNAIGPFGANLAYALFESVGYVAYLVPLTLLTLAITTFLGRKLRFGPERLLGGVFFLLSAAAIAGLGGIVPTTEGFAPGGFIGRLLATGLAAGLGTVGGGLVAGALALSSVLVMTHLSLRATFRGLAAVAGSVRVIRPLLHALVSLGAMVGRGLRRCASLMTRALRAFFGLFRKRAKAPAPLRQPSAPLPAKVVATPTQRRPIFNVSVRRVSVAVEPTTASVAGPPAPAVTAPAPPTISVPTQASAVAARRLAAAAVAAAAPTASPPPVPPVAHDDEEQAMPLAAPLSAKEAARAAASARLERTAERSQAKAPPTRSSDSGFMAPAAREVAGGAEVTPSVGTRATVVRAVRKADAKPRDFRLPPTTLLDEPGEQCAVAEAELLDCASQIVAKCAEFGIGGQVLHVHPGPVVTTFEFKPDAGIKLSRITNLEDDLAMALKAETIRIDRIPGKSTIGIEVPNRRREVISFRELVESDVFTESSSKLTMIVGKTIDGAPYVADLAKMPHLLIAGSTGSGKSVALNSMITSILFKATPEEVKLIMVDPKMLELGMYRDIPHLLTPVVTNPKLASNALKWAVKEMENRYARLAGCGVRNIEQYNAWVAKQAKSAQLPLVLEGVEHTPLPFIVIVIDELADLMMIAAADVEDSICRLAQMARAVGIHLILATQRPSVDVITGVIKANLPSRIAMRVASKVDSRTILDSNGSEQLLGKGDMLFLPTGSSRLKRLHGPYLSETETAGICEYLKTQRTPDYDDKVCEEPPGEKKEGVEDEGHDDELFDEAARIVIERGEASVSYLQRRLRVGYSRAARIVDMLEGDGIVSAPDGSKVRQVLVGPDYFSELDRARQATSG